MQLSHDFLYRMPFSTTDNPIGWLEVTDVCNIHCRGCYRENALGHRTLSELVEEIRLFREERNCDNISVAGGEPTCHPQIEDIARAIRGAGMKCVLVTNGQKLDRDFLSRLRDAGVTHLGLHVDSFQERPGWEGADEDRLMELRQQLADLAAEVGVGCNMGMTVYPENLDAVRRVVRWAQDNYGKVTGLVFITYRGVPLGERYRHFVNGRQVPASELGYSEGALDEIHVTSDDVARLIAQEEPEYQPHSYLNGTLDFRSNKWLVATRVGRPGRTFGYLGPRVMELTQAAGHLRRGRYSVFVGSPRRGPGILVASLVDQVIRPAVGRFLLDGIKHPTQAASPLYTQSITVVQAPDMVLGAGGNMCDSCPDVTFWNGRMVNSCRLDELRKWGGYLTVVEDAQA